MERRNAGPGTDSAKPQEDPVPGGILAAQPGFWRGLVEDAPHLVQCVDPEGRFVYVNRAWHALLGYSEGELPGLKLLDVIPPDMRPHCERLLAKMLAGECAAVEVELLAKDGRRIPVSGVARYRFAGGKPLYTETILRDATDIRMAEERWRSLVTNATDIIMILDRGARIDYINRVLPGFEKSAVTGKQATDFILSSHQASFLGSLARVFASVRPAVVSVEGFGAGNATAWYETKISPIASSGAVDRVVAVCRDITDRKRAEEERLRTQKLEALGAIAGGIAHDLNNMLTGVLCNASLLRGGGISPEEAPEILDEIEQSGERARLVVGQLLTFTEFGAPVKKTLSPGRVVADAARLASRGKRSLCETEIAADLRPVDADAGQIGQAVMNLVLRAHAVIEERGVVRVRAGNAPGSDGEAKFVKVEVTDHGPGLSADERACIFEPYQRLLAGGGLGLAAVKSIVERHGGSVEVESHGGTGTTFRILLPVSRAAPENRANRETVAARGARILAMDDDEDVRHVLGRTLGRLGYEVDMVEDGTAAVAAYAEASAGARPYAAVILDLTVPGAMGGAEAMAKILELDPDARGIVSSGYSTDVVLPGHAGFKASLSKPYVAGDLRRVLGAVLGAGEG